MRGSKRSRNILMALSALLLLFFVLDIALGSVPIPLGQIMAVLANSKEAEESWRIILLESRLPKAITALLAGASLSLCGLLMQSLFRNPVAGPYILGISSGASLGVALLLLGGSAFSWSLQGLAGSNSWVVSGAGVAGATLILLIVLLISFRIRDVMSLLILGLMLGSFVSALVGLLQFLSDKEALRSFIMWSFGSLSGTGWQQVRVLFVITSVGIIASFAIARSMDVLLLGEGYAHTMGLPVRSVRAIIILITSLLAGTMTAFCGPIAFIGIAVPHICRLLLDSSGHQVLVPACILGGGTILLACDVLSVLPGSSRVLPINVVTSMLGAPFVVWIVLRSRKIQAFF